MASDLLKGVLRQHIILRNASIVPTPIFSILSLFYKYINYVSKNLTYTPRLLIYRLTSFITSRMARSENINYETTRFNEAEATTK